MEKVRALLALATSPNIDEARNAALAAVRLIAEYKVILSLPAPANGVTFPPPSIRVKTVSPAERRTKTAIRATTRAGNPGEWKKMKAKFEGYCKWCKKKVHKNASIYWSPDDGAYHAVCYSNSGVP